MRAQSTGTGRVRYRRGDLPAHPVEIAEACHGDPKRPSPQED